MFDTAKDPGVIGPRGKRNDIDDEDAVMNGSDRSDLHRIIRFIHGEDGDWQQTEKWIKESPIRRSEWEQLREMADEFDFISADEQIYDLEGQVKDLTNKVLKPDKLS